MGTTVSEIRGKIGGIVFSRNKGGAYIRKNTKPTGATSPLASAVRNVFGSVSRAWSQIADDERVLWNEYAPLFSNLNVFGDNQPLTGKALFQKLTTNWKIAGWAGQPRPSIPTNVPAIIADHLTASYAMATSVSSVRLTVALPDFDIDPEDAIVIDASPLLSNGTSNANNALKQIGVYSYDQISYGVLDLTANYTAKFGTLGQASDLPGQYQIFVRMSVIDNVTGQRSTYQIVKAIVNVIPIPAP